jgi:cytoskeletal protein CcmA (bactofilin family)
VSADAHSSEPNASHGAAIQQTGETPALVPRDGHFEGQIAVVGRTRIDGEVLGSLRGPGTLVLGPSAHVEGPIECEVVDSSGAIFGCVTATRRVRLGPGARLEGDLEAPVLEVDDDAVWNGVARVGLPGRQRLPND